MGQNNNTTTMRPRVVMPVIGILFLALSPLIDAAAAEPGKLSVGGGKAVPATASTATRRSPWSSGTGRASPHWQPDGCKACHRAPATPGRLNLVERDVDRLCARCHGGEDDHSYIHPSGVAVTRRDMRKRMPETFRSHLDRKGRLTCATCHDVEAQCLRERRRERTLNPRFFRDGPYRDRSDICYVCHDRDEYRRLNAHDQVDDKGRIKEYTCRLCHASPGKLKRAKGIEDVDFHVKGSLVWICASCHPLIPHPAQGFTFARRATEPNHLVVPPPAIARRMKESEKRNDVILPLDPNTGRIFCATCHNPHARGVIGEPAAARGADEDKRLRTKRICTNCHDK